MKRDYVNSVLSVKKSNPIESCHYPKKSRFQKRFYHVEKQLC